MATVLSGINEDLFRLVLAQGEVVAADFDFDGVTQWREADEFDLGADEQAHFHQPRAAGRGQLDLSHGGGSAQGDRGKRLSSS